MGEQSDANSCVIDKEALQALTRWWHPEGEDEDVDFFVTGVRTSSDELTGVLREEKYEHCDLGDAIEEVVHAHNEQAAEARAQTEDLNLDQDTHEETEIISSARSYRI